MKKIILLFAALAIAGGIQNIYAQSKFKNADAAVAEAESIIRSFGEDSDADVVSIGSMLVKLAKPFVDGPEAKATLDIAKGLLVADFEDCSEDVKKSFTSRMSKLVASLGNLKLMEARDGDDNVIIIGDENKISGMLVCSDDYEVVLIKLSAKPEDMGKILKQAN